MSGSTTHRVRKHRSAFRSRKRELGYTLTNPVGDTIPQTIDTLKGLAQIGTTNYVGNYRLRAWWHGRWRSPRAKRERSGPEILTSHD